MAMSDNVGIEEIHGDGFVGDESFVGDLLSGDDDSGNDDALGDLIGAYNRVRASNKNKKARDNDALRSLINKRVSSGSIVRDVNPTKSREYVVGFDITPVSALGSATIPKQPQVLFRPERLIIPSNIAIDFMLSDLKVGKNSQFTASGAVPAVVFIESAFGVRLKLDTCQISMQIIISVTNLANQSRNFMAAIIGPAVE